MSLPVVEYDEKSGLPLNRTYLQESLLQMKSAWEKRDFGEDYLHWGKL